MEGFASNNPLGWQKFFQIVNKTPLINTKSVDTLKIPHITPLEFTGYRQ